MKQTRPTARTLEPRALARAARRDKARRRHEATRTLKIGGAAYPTSPSPA